MEWIRITETSIPPKSRAFIGFYSDEMDYHRRSKGEKVFEVGIFKYCAEQERFLRKKQKGYPFMGLLEDDFSYWCELLLKDK